MEIGHVDRRCDETAWRRPASTGAIVLGLWLLLLLGTGTSLAATEISFRAPPPEQPPQRRLSPDPHRPQEAPSAQRIELAQVQDGAEDALRLAIKASNSSVRAYGLDDARRGVPTINLGVARLRAGQPAAALRDLRTAIALLASEQRPRDARLAEAYYGLGAAQFALDNWPAAIEAFEEGLQQHRVHHGLASESQIDFLRALAVANRARGDTREADRWQDRRIEVAEQVFAANPARMAWTYVSAGRWFRDGGRSADATALHARAVNVIEAGYGPDTRLLLGPLMELAVSAALYQRQPGAAPLPPGQSADLVLARARRLVTQDRLSPAAQRAQTLERLADTHWVLGLRGDAAALYARAAEVGAIDGQTRGYQTPAFLVFHPPVPAADTLTLRGYVLAEFEVDRQGGARKVRLVEGTSEYLSKVFGPGLVSAIRAARLRPQFVAGVPVATTGVRYRFEFPPPGAGSRVPTSVAARQDGLAPLPRAVLRPG